MPSRVVSSHSCLLLYSIRTQHAAEPCLFMKRSLHTPFHSPSAYRQKLSSGSQVLKKLKFGLDPYTYTSGRWLRQDDLERSSRYIGFNFEALCQKVIELCTNAKGITDCRNIEGGFNRVFIFTLDNTRRVVSRLPFPMAGPAGLTTRSEVATIRYLQAKNSVPIPKVIEWNFDAKGDDNPVGAEFIIMEHAASVSLQQTWPEMKGDRRVTCIDAIYRQMKEVVDLPFSIYGSLYLADDQSSSSRQLDGDVYGSHCETRYWDCNVNERRYYHDAPPNRGPWANMAEYCDGLIDAGISRLPHSTFDNEGLPAYHGSIPARQSLLAHTRNLLKVMAGDARIQGSSAPVLFHPDLNMRNTFVSESDPTIITGIIDWQAASIEPAFWYSDEVPDFATPVEAEDNITAKTFNIASQYHIPAISNPRSMDENLFRPLRYSHRTWKDGAVALRHELIETSRHWESFGFAGKCPFQLPPANELADHQEKYRLFEAAQSLRYDLAGLLNAASDGWVPADDWEFTKLVHKVLYDGMLQAVLENKDVDEDEPVRDEATLRSIWPFDLP